MALWLDVEKNKPARGASPFHNPAECLLGVLGEGVGIFKNHQLEFSIKRAESSVPFNYVLEIRYQREVFLVKMDIPLILFEV